MGHINHYHNSNQVNGHLQEQQTNGAGAVDHDYAGANGHVEGNDWTYVNPNTFPRGYSINGPAFYSNAANGVPAARPLPGIGRPAGNNADGRDYSPLTDDELRRLRPRWTGNLDDPRLVSGMEGADVRAEMREILKEAEEAEAASAASPPTANGTTNGNAKN